MPTTCQHINISAQLKSRENLKSTTYSSALPRPNTSQTKPLHSRQNLPIDYIMKAGEMVVNILKEEGVELFDLFDLYAMIRQ